MHLSYSIRCFKITTDQKRETLSLSENHPRYSAHQTDTLFAFSSGYHINCSTILCDCLTLLVQGFLPGVVGIAFGLNRAAVTNNSEVMRDHRAIPFPWTLLLPALRQRVTECTT
ncbi:hypothetical protein NXS19_003104 [Fusarium pseudograminearum]|nr:hypothetical protein NXS19_003104 [Fusarium pseudograminearum]